MTKMNGTIMQPIQKGMRHPHSESCAGSSSLLSPKPISAATTMATC